MADLHSPERHDQNEPNAFVRSVIDLSPDDIVTSDKKHLSVLSFLGKHVRTLILIVCAGVLVWSVLYILDTLKQYAEAEDLYEGVGGLIMGNNGEAEMMYSSPQGALTPDYNASQNLTDEEIGDIINTVTVNKEFELVRNKLVSLKKQYPDLYGWIILEGTPINYPIMQSDDNDYYLDHSYTGGKLKAGAIFADYRCDRDLMRNYNLVLYGHHMTNNTMFHSLDNFLNASFFYTNNTVKIFTLDGMFTYKVFSAYETDKYYHYIRTHFTTRESFVNFANEMRDNSIHPVPGLTFGTGDRLLTMSTCTNRSDDGRLSIQAVMVDYYLANN